VRISFKLLVFFSLFGTSGCTVEVEWEKRSYRIVTVAEKQVDDAVVSCDFSVDIQGTPKGQYGTSLGPPYMFSIFGEVSSCSKLRIVGLRVLDPIACVQTRQIGEAGLELKPTGNFTKLVYKTELLSCFEPTRLNVELLLQEEGDDRTLRRTYLLEPLVEEGVKSIPRFTT
jgi:hypothetical protein